MEVKERKSWRYTNPYPWQSILWPIVDPIWVTFGNTVKNAPPPRPGLSYQTLSPVWRTFVFLGSRCTQPLTPRNAHAFRYEFSKWRTGQRGKFKKQSDFAMNTQHTPSLERRIYGRKIQNCWWYISGPSWPGKGLWLSFKDESLPWKLTKAFHCASKETSSSTLNAPWDGISHN